MAALVVARVWWGHEAERRLRAEVAAAQARGEPVLPADFDTPQTDAQTADKLLETAGDHYVESREFGWLLSHDQFPLSEKSMEQVRVFSAANKKALDCIRQSRALPIVSWGAPPGGELPPRLPQHQGQHQQVLSRVLRWKALREHQLGNDREAAELILDLLHQQRVLEHGPPTFIVHLLALVVQSRATECVFEISSTLDLSDSPQSSAGRSPVNRQQASQIIHDLLDDTDSQHAGRRAWYAIRMVDLHAAEEIRALASHTSSSLLAPMYVLDEARIARRMGEVAAAAGQPNWPSAAARLPVLERIDRSASHLQCTTRMLSILFESDETGRIRASYHLLADRRAAAIQLAVRLYRIDHAGEYPRSLNDLVPTYLPSVPLDPMAVDNSPMRYRSDSKPPIVYSVGDNGNDDGGTGKPGTDRWAGLDAVYPLEFIPQPAVSAGSGSPAPRTPRRR